MYCHIDQGLSNLPSESEEIGCLWPAYILGTSARTEQLCPALHVREELIHKDVHWFSGMIAARHGRSLVALGYNYGAAAAVPVVRTASGEE